MRVVEAKHERVRMFSQVLDRRSTAQQGDCVVAVLAVEAAAGFEVLRNSSHRGQDPEAVAGAFGELRDTLFLVVFCRVFLESRRSKADIAHVSYSSERSKNVPFTVPFTVFNALARRDGRKECCVGPGVVS